MSNYSQTSRLRKELVFLRAHMDNVIRELDETMQQQIIPFAGASQVVELVSKRFGLQSGALMTQTNAPVIAGPRQIAHHLMHCVLGLPLKAIGVATQMHHTTVAYSCERVKQLRAANPDYDRKIWELEDELRGMEVDDGISASAQYARKTRIPRIGVQRGNAHHAGKSQ